MGISMMGKKSHIIAEAGTNHNGSLQLAMKLVDVAAESKADSIKFQLIYPEGLYLPFLHDGSGLRNPNPVYQKRRASMLKDDDYREIASYSKSRGIPFSASVFDLRGIALLHELDVQYIKIASCDLNNSRLLLQAADTGRKLVLSTGMASLGEIERAVSDLFSAGFKDMVLMHCVSVYPCPTAQMNLGFLKTLKQAFGLPVGLSDHTEQSLAACASVVMGAEWIEKHFTLDRTMDGFDHAYALEPSGFEQFVRDVRSMEEACIRREKVGPEEAIVRQRARRGLYAAKEIPPGAPLGKEDVLVVRPEGPLKPADLGLILGRISQRAIQSFEPLSLDQFYL